MTITFAQLGLSETLVGALAKRDITKPFPVQARNHPRCSQRPRRFRYGTDRIWQNSRLRSTSPYKSRESEEQAAPRFDPCSDPRAG